MADPLSWMRPPKGTNGEVSIDDQLANCRRLPEPAIPAQAGIQYAKPPPWIPASAGMSGERFAKEIGKLMINNRLRAVRL